ncbi:MAG: hypothetical protein KKD46_03945 [Euryarchaeota archaeon]|nr:hypothetical protein [Euryarchaeota archaeon]MCG2735705.1 hypothetical protein [Candidatus Methanoperedenaceae archaeon]
MKKEYRRKILIGLTLLLAGILAGAFLKNAYNMIFTPLILAGGILVYIGAFRHLVFKEEPDKDERTIKLGNAAFAHSWLVTVLFASLLLMFEKYGAFVITAYQALVAVLAAASLSAIVFMLYFNRRGDLE